jgi:uncharacterized protein (TIGR03083 family)
VSTREDYHAALARDAASFTEIIRSADLAAEVRDCPGWTVLDLARHLGGVHRWAFEIVATGAPGEEPGGPATRDELAEWFAEGAAQLLDILRRADPEAATWTFGPKPRRVSFWSRRQAHETAMHLGDAQRALGHPATADATMAADGVEEVLSVFFPRQVRLGRIPPLTQGVRLVLSDVPQTSFVLAGDGTDPLAPTSATMRGPAAQLLLVLWGRSDVDGLDVQGDPAVVRDALAAGITP